MPIQSPRGTRDILPQQQPIWEFVRQTARRVAEQMAYQPITVPTYEELGLFQRAIGEGTDIRDKELFLVKGIRAGEGDAQYALRPEGTAGIVRAYIEHGMQTWPQPVKLFTFVNNFRYDRPQKGRYREHVQFDIEYFGDTGPFADAWVIYTTWRFLRELGLNNLTLQLNSLGTLEDRATYMSAIQEYFRPLVDQLSPDSASRLEHNPLRILDSKDAADRALLANAPKLPENLSETSRQHFKQVQSYLSTWGVPFVLNANLVRGLDYYCHTAFEWTVTGNEGQQDSLGGGGRYDGLVKQLDGPETGAVGAGIGLDRVVEELERQKGADTWKLTAPIAFVAATPGAGREAALILIDQLLNAGLVIDSNLGKESLGSQLKSAGRSGARFALIIGDEEAATQEVTLKNLENGEQRRLPISEVEAAIR